MGKAHYTLISGLRKNDSRSYYEFSVSVTDEKIYFEEVYEYFGDDGRTFEYALEMPATYLDAFLLVLLKRFLKMGKVSLWVSFSCGLFHGESL